MKITIEIIHGVEGDCLTLNDHRIAGPKPWGGGKVTKQWTTTIEQIEDAFRGAVKVINVNQMTQAESNLVAEIAAKYRIKADAQKSP